MTALDATFDAAISLRAHLRTELPDADIRTWRIDRTGIRLQVGPELGIPTDVEIRPVLFEVATTVDPYAKFTHVDHVLNRTYRWLCQWEGVSVVVSGEGRDEASTRPAPTPLPAELMKGVAA